ACEMGGVRRSGSLNMKPGKLSLGGVVPCVLYHSIIPAKPLLKRLCMVLHSSPYWPPSPQFCGGRMLSHWKSTLTQASCACATYPRGIGSAGETEYEGFGGS